MNKVWIIEQGCYSDYRVVGIFSTSENAHKVCAWINANDPSDRAEVAERNLDPVVDDLNAGRSQWHVQMHRDGTTELVKPAGSGYNLEDSGHVWDRPNAPAYKGKGFPALLTYTVWALDESHAVKIVNERRIQMIASGEWK